MAINRRRAPTREVAIGIKLSGHRHETSYAKLIGGETISGVQKGDVKDTSGKLHSVKSGKKWQVFLYGYERINNSNYLKILKPCLEAFPTSAEMYFKDREECISYKEVFDKKNGRDKAKQLTNQMVKKNICSNNAYVESKERLEKATLSVCEILKDELKRRDFFREALFNNDEVDFLAIIDTTDKRNKVFEIFTKEDVLDVLSKNLFPRISRAGIHALDYNVGGQKTLFCYVKPDGKEKNIVEIEIRNDSDKHYRQVRFNMYAKDALSLLHLHVKTSQKFSKHIIAHGEAINGLSKVKFLEIED